MIQIYHTFLMIIIYIHFQDVICTFILVHRTTTTWLQYIHTCTQDQDYLATVHSYLYTGPRLPGYSTFILVHRTTTTWLQYIHTCTQDHDYLATKWSGSLAEQLDRLRKTHPEIDDLLKDHATMTEKVKHHEEMLARGQISLLHELKLHPVLFCYYTGLPSYSVFTSLFNYLQPV